MRLFSILTICSFFIFNAAQAETLRIGMSPDFPPWGFTDSSGEIVGFEREMGNDICKRINVECTWANQAYDGLIPSLLIGKFDLVISGMSITDDRKKKIDFSTPYAEGPAQFALAANSPLATMKTREELEKELSGKVVGVQSGTTHDAVMIENFKGVDVRRYQRNEDIAEDIIVGRLDAGLLEISVWNELMKDRDGKLTLVGPTLTSADYKQFGDGIGIGMKKGRTDLKKRIDDAIHAMIEDGTMKKLSEKYFGFDVSFKGKTE